MLPLRPARGVLPGRIEAIGIADLNARPVRQIDHRRLPAELRLRRYLLQREPAHRGETGQYKVARLPEGNRDGMSLRAATIVVEGTKVAHAKPS